MDYKNIRMVAKLIKIETNKQTNKQTNKTSKNKDFIPVLNKVYIILTEIFTKLILLKPEGKESSNLQRELRD